MLSVERTKELLSTLDLSIEEAEHIRDVAFMLADLAYEAWIDKHKVLAEQPKQQNNPTT